MVESPDFVEFFLACLKVFGNACIPNIHSATPLDAGWYGAVVRSLMLSPSQMLHNSHIDDSCISWSLFPEFNMVMKSCRTCRGPSIRTKVIHMEFKLVSYNLHCEN